MLAILTAALFSWAPFAIKMFNLSDPPIGAFRTESHLYVVAYHGTVYKFSFDPLDTSDFAEISDSFELPLEKIVPGHRGKDSNFRVHNIVYWHKRLVVLTDYGVWASDTGEDFQRWKPITRDRPLEIAGDSENLFILFSDKVSKVIERNGDYLIEKVAKANLTYPCFSSFVDGILFFESSDTLWILHGDSLTKFSFIIPKNKAKKHRVFIRSINRGLYPSIRGNDKFVARDTFSGYTVAYVGGIKSSADDQAEVSTYYLVLDSSFNVVDSIRILDFTHRDIVFNHGYFWIFGDKSIFGGAHYALKGYPPSLKDSLSTKLVPLVVVPGDKGFNFVSYRPSFIGIFSNKAPEHLYSLFVEFLEIFWHKKKLPLIHSQPKDFILFSSSFNPCLSFDERNNGIVLVVPRIDESLDYAASLVSWAEGHQFPWSARAALDSLDAAMEIYRVLDPDRLTYLFKLRNRLYQQVKIMESIRTNWLRLLFALIWAFTIFMFLKARQAFHKFKAQYAPLPAEDTIKSVLRIPIFHKFPSLWQPLMEKGDFSCEILKDDTLHRNLLDSLQMMVAIEKEFRHVHPRWENMFKKAKSSLLLLAYIFKLQRLCQFGGIVRNGFKKALVDSLNAIAHAREELKTLLEKGRADIIQGALLPVIEDIRRKYSAQGVIVNTEISQQASYTFYPSELAKFKSCFRAILENAVEAYSDDGTLKKIEIKASALPDVLEISIRDYGRGMDPDTISEIFKPGFSHGKHGKGRGYGLAGCDELFKKYGEVEVHSEPGRGTTFNIKIYFLPPRR